VGTLLVYFLGKAHASGFFPQVQRTFPPLCGVIQQKSPLSPGKPEGDVFRSYDEIWDLFYTYEGFFYGRNGRFGEVRACSFPQLRWKSQIA
jgi:hypothetical protein